MEERTQKTEVPYYSSELIYVCPCDRKEHTLSYCYGENVLEVLSQKKETWTLQIAGSNELILGFGNVFFVRQYRDELLIAFQGDEKYFRWLWDWFDKSGFQMVEMPMMVIIKRVHSPK